MILFWRWCPRHLTGHGRRRHLSTKVCEKTSSERIVSFHLLETIEETLVLLFLPSIFLKLCCLVRSRLLLLCDVLFVRDRAEIAFTFHASARTRPSTHDFVTRCAALLVAQLGSFFAVFSSTRPFSLFSLSKSKYSTICAYLAVCWLCWLIT